MTATLNDTTIEQLSKRYGEPAWLTQLRRAAFARHAQLPWPHASDEVWRRTDVTLLDPAGFAPAEPQLLESVALTDAQISQYASPLGGEALLARANGAWISQEPPPGVTVQELERAAQAQSALIRPLLESDGFTLAEQKLLSLNSAFHHDGLLLRVAPETQVQTPVRLVHLCSSPARVALFPLTVIHVGRGSRLTLIDEYASLTPRKAADGVSQLINARVELILEPGASVSYVRVQQWDGGAREFLLQRATLAEGAELTTVNLSLGAAVSKAHIISRLAGANSSSKLYGFAFGRAGQHVDQHSLQDHLAPRTTSDLLFKAALTDHSRMIYTGLIRIAKSAQGTDAYQANHNLLLSHSARAETIPMLEILADDVRCKHGASVGPIDEEQLFYLGARGIPRDAAERLLVMGFVEPVIEHVPFEPLQQRLREHIERSLG